MNTPLIDAPIGPGETVDIALTLFLCMFACILVVAVFGYLAERSRLRFATRLLAAGQPVPPSLFDRRPRSELVRGIVLVAAGVGIALYFALGGDFALARAGLVPGAIGIGYLVGRTLESRRDAG